MSIAVDIYVISNDYDFDGYVDYDSVEIASSPDWILFVFSDISVTSNSTYYIVMRTSSGNILEYYVWDYGGNNPYAVGSRWSYRASGYSLKEDTRSDFCFKIYSI